MIMVAMEDEWTFAPLPATDDWLVSAPVDLMTLHGSMVQRSAICTRDFLVFGEPEGFDTPRAGKALDWVPLHQVFRTNIEDTVHD